MPKKPKAAKTEAVPKPMHATQPWKCRHHKDHSDIVAYVEAASDWEIVASVNRTAGASAEEMANFICGLVNDQQKSKNLLLAAMEALELCLEDSTLTFSSEQAAEHVVTNIKRMV